MYPLPFALQLGVDVTPKRGTALVFAPAFLDGRLEDVKDRRRDDFPIFLVHLVAAIYILNRVYSASGTHR